MIIKVGSHKSGSTLNSTVFYPNGQPSLLQ